MMKLKFNWYTELDKAIKIEPYFIMYKYLFDLAKNWETCACGQSCKALPKDILDRPVDKELLEYGNVFSFCIKNRQWKYALITLNRIEARTAKLLKEITP